MKRIGEDELRNLEDHELWWHCARTQVKIWWRAYMSLPWQMRMGVDLGLFEFMFLAVARPAIDMPTISIPIIWMGAYCLAFILKVVRPARPRHRRIRWLKPVIDEQNEELQWKEEQRGSVHWVKGHLQDHDTGPLHL